MLRAKILPEILSQVVNEDISTAMLMTTEGALLGSCGKIENLDNKLLGAIVTNAWNDYDDAGRLLFPSQPIDFQALTLQNGGWIGIASAGPGCLVCAYSTCDTNIGYVKAKLVGLGKYFEKLLENIATAAGP